MRSKTLACLSIMLLAAIPSCGRKIGRQGEKKSLKADKGEKPTDVIKVSKPDRNTTKGVEEPDRPVQKLAAGEMDSVMNRVDVALSSTRYASYSYGYRRGRPALSKDKTNAPYFHVPGKKEGTEELPLKSTSAKVDIAGVIAQVRVEQVYKNEGKTPIEAVYVFPGSTRSAVHGMRMKIGERTIEAKIKERKQARQEYNAAKEAGQRASLLEQQRPNVFTMNVANIMPGDVIKVELDYSELVVPEDGVYEFVYPTVVGPRYVGAESPKESWTANPHLSAGKKEPYKFGISLHLESPIGIKDLASPSHKVDVSWQSKSSADVKLANEGGGNRDFVVRYRLAGDKIETGIMVFEDQKEKFFLLMMEPPKRVEKAQLPRREYIFVIDVSGSMYGFPLQTAKVLIKDLLKGLGPKDLFNVILFASGFHLMSPKSLPATEGNLQRAVSVIDQQRGGGGTELMKAIQAALNLPRPGKGVSRTVSIITDGYVRVEAQAFRYIRKNLGKGNVFAFGIGSSVNRGIIEGMARAGMGEPFVVLNGNEATQKAEKFRKYIKSPVLTGIEVSYANLTVNDAVPKSPPDLMAQRPLIVFGKINGKVVGAVKVSGITGQGRFDKVMEVHASMSKAQNKPLKVLWARKWVEILTDQLIVLRRSEDLTNAITRVGLGYSILTQFTSFVAVDTKKVRKDGKLVTVKQPLPMPQGVSNYAIGTTFREIRGGLSPARRSFGAPSSMPSSPSSADPLAAILGSSSSRDKGKAPEAAKESDDRRSAVQVLSLTNVSSSAANRIRRMVSLTLRAAPCLRQASSKTLTVTVTIDAQGKITVQGASQLARCIRIYLRSVARISLGAGFRKDSSKEMVLRLRLTL